MIVRNYARIGPSTILWFLVLMSGTLCFALCLVPRISVWNNAPLSTSQRLDQLVSHIQHSPTLNMHLQPSGADLRMYIYFSSTDSVKAIIIEEVLLNSHYPDAKLPIALFRGDSFSKHLNFPRTAALMSNKTSWRITVKWHDGSSFTFIGNSKFDNSMAKQLTP